MRLAKNALIIALTMLTLAFAMSAQTLRSKDDPRNIAPTVGTGGPVGGPTGLFTIYDGQTLRRGEYTFSIAYSNYDRDPGNVDITQVPVSFQIGLSDNLEIFFNTDAYKGIKVNSPNVLSSFYLPNSQLKGAGGLQVPAAIVLAPAGTTATALTNTAVYRPAGAPFVQYPYTGGQTGSFGIPFPFGPGQVFGFTGAATLGSPSGGGASANFPGVGSVYGSILPGVVLSTQGLTNVSGGAAGTAPVVYSLAPSYLPDAPFINRIYGTSAFSTYTAGAKWRLTDVKNPLGLGVTGFYRWYGDKATDNSGFNQLQRGASPGGNKGDFGATLFADARLRPWLNISGNVGYVYNSSVKGTFPNGEATILDRPDELQYGVGLDFPTNEHFQPILEFLGTRYVGGRTPNAFEVNPMDGIAGVRIYPKRWYGFGLAYRYNFNQIDRGALDGSTFNQSVNTTRRTTVLINNNGAGTSANTLVTPGIVVASSGALNTVYPVSNDPHGFILQAWIGRRNERGGKQEENLHPDVTGVDLSNTKVVLPCPPGQIPAEGACSDNMSVGVKTTAKDPEGDTLTYNYTVSGGRVVGSGPNVSWDLSGLRPGTYTITSAVDDGCGFCGKTQTKTITVEQCNCKTPIKPCDCPSLSVSGPSDLLKDGQPASFTANVNGGTQDNTVTYNWTVSAGTISGGQGTPAITVDTTGLANQSVTATVEIGGLCKDCPRTASATANVADKTPLSSTKIDEFGAQKPDEIKNKLDNLYLQLNADPTAKGYIINYGTAKQKADRVKVLKAALKFRNADVSRVEFVDGGEGEFKTELWITPQGAPKPPGVQ